MDSREKHGLLQAVTRAREQAAAAASEIRAQPDAPKAVESAVQEAEESLTRLAKRLSDDA